MEESRNIVEQEPQEMKTWQEPEMKSMASDSAEGATCRNGSGAVPLCLSGSSPRYATNCFSGATAYK